MATFPRAGALLNNLSIHGIGAYPDDTLYKDVGTDEGGQRYIDRLQGLGMLPLVVPNARILRYGYESQWFGANVIRQKSWGLQTLSRLDRLGIFKSTTGLISFGTSFRGAKRMSQSQMIEAARREHEADQE